MNAPIPGGGGAGSATGAEPTLFHMSHESGAAELPDDGTEMVWESNSDGRIIGGNKTWRRVLGYSTGEISLTVDLVAEEHRGKYLSAARQAESGTDVDALQLVFIGKNGQRIVGSGKLSPRPNGKPGSRACFRDITARHREEAMRGRLIATLEASSDFVALVTREGRVDYLNRAGRALVAIPEDSELARLSIRDLLPEAERQRLLGEVLRARLSGGVWQGDAALKGPNDEPIPVSLVIVAHPSTHPGEPPFFISIVARDLRERLRAESALRTSEARFRAALEGGSDAFIVLHPERDAAGALRDFTIVECNTRSALFLRTTRQQLIGRRLGDVIPSATGDMLRRRFAHVVETGETMDEELETLGETPLWLHLQVVRVDDGIAVTAADVTERYRTKRLKDQLIATVSHELRSPLTAVGGALDLLSRADLALPEPQRLLLDMARRNAERMVRLVSDLLDLERLESGISPLDPDVFTVSGLVEAAVDTVSEGTAGAVAIDTSRVDRSPLAVWCDADRIVQVLVNLLGNGAKFSPPAGVLTVDAVAEGEFVRFSIKDQGPGIPPEALERIFTRFAQIRPTDGRERGGVGLGLAICRAIVQQHGGRIWADSTVGQGSSFCFTLPAADREPGAAAAM